MLPPARVALHLPAIRIAAVLVVGAPTGVAWFGPDAQTPARLRVVGMLLAAAVAMVWDDRCAVLAAATPVGLPAVRHGRAILLLAMLLSAWGLSCLAARDEAIAWRAVNLQSAGTSALILAVVGWFARGRDGEQQLVLPVPVLLLAVAAMTRLPTPLSLLGGRPGEQGRWLLLLAASLALVVRLDRDPASP